MFKKIIIIIICFGFSKQVEAQVTAISQWNSDSFCGVNQILQLQDVSTGPVVTRLWTLTGPAGFTTVNSGLPNINISLTEIGLYSLSLEVCDVSNMCNTVFHIDAIEVLQVPQASVTSTGFCMNNNNIFSASTLPNSLLITDFNWDFGSGFFSGAANEVYEFTTLGNVNVQLEVVAQNGCRDTAILNSNVNPKPQAIIDANDTLVCVGNTINVNGLSSIWTTPGIQYFWDNDFNTGIDDTNSAFTILANADRQIMLAIVDDNNCVDTAFQNVFIVQNPEVNFDVDYQCEDVAFTLNAQILQTGGSPIDSIYWFIDSTSYQTGNSISYTHNTDDSIPVILFATNEEGCLDGIQKYIVIDELAQANILTPDTVICMGDSSILRTSNTSNFVWMPNGETEAEVTISPSEVTTYTLIASSAHNACPDDESTVIIEVLLEPEYTVEASSLLTSLGTPVDLELSYNPQYSNNDSIFWLDHGTANELENTLGSENSFIALESVSFPIGVNYTKNATTCLFKTNIDVEVDETCSKKGIYIPNVFTPNSDSNNDNFVIKGYSLDYLVSFTIFDRSGNEMYHIENIDFKNANALDSWNGNNKNNVRCNSGVYVYSYKAVCINGLETQGSGNITLIR